MTKYRKTAFSLVTFVSIWCMGICICIASHVVHTSWPISISYHVNYELFFLLCILHISFSHHRHFKAIHLSCHANKTHFCDFFHLFLFFHPLRSFILADVELYLSTTFYRPPSLSVEHTFQCIKWQVRGSSIQHSFNPCHHHHHHLPIHFYKIIYFAFGLSMPLLLSAKFIWLEWSGVAVPSLFWHWYMAIYMCILWQWTREKKKNRVILPK